YGLFSGNTPLGFYVDAEDIRVPSDGEDRIGPGDASDDAGDAGDADDQDARKASDMYHKRIHPDGPTTYHPAKSGPMEKRQYGLADQPYYSGPQLTKFINDRY